MPTIEELQQQITALQNQLNELSGQVVPTIEIRHYIADEGKIFIRDRDQTNMGKDLYLGYDYSLGFRRIDYIEFYSQIPEPINYENT